jgi:large subunit ribosomal protein L1
MPNPKTGTVTFDVTKAVREIKAGKVEFRVDKTAIIHVPVGRMSFDDQKIADNTLAVIHAVLRAKPPAAKGKYVESIYLCSTMGPSIAVDPVSVEIPVA